MLAYNFCSLGLIFVLKKNDFFFHFNRTAEPDQSILIFLSFPQSNLIFKGGGHLFHAVVLASAPPSTNFKSIYSNQFKRYEYIQGIWEMQNFMKNTMVKKFLARAHFRARARRIFCLLGQILMIFEFSKRNEIWRAPRAQVRARQIFFYECIVCQKISMQFFWFVHSSKSEVFRAI